RPNALKIASRCALLGVITILLQAPLPVPFPDPRRRPLSGDMDHVVNHHRLCHRRAVGLRRPAQLL
ncbi:MAG: hypothetical protein VW057_14610, partial [Rhodospirillaceae bacterium]